MITLFTLTLTLAIAPGAASAWPTRAPHSRPLAAGLRRPGRALRASASDARRPQDADVGDELSPAAAIWRTALPLFAACMCEPFLTLIDTACVGNLGRNTAAGLAALSVNAAVFDVLANIFSSLCTASTNVVATAGAKGPRVLRRAVDVALGISAAIGVCGGLLVLLSSGWLAQTVFGLRDAEVIARALAYMRIRAAFVPVVCLNYALYGILLARKDTSVAVAAVAVSAAVNCALDVLLVGWLHLSTAGAAVATVASQLCVCAILLRHLARTLPAAPAASPPVRARRGAAASPERLSLAQRLRLPSSAELAPFGAVFGAVGLGTATTSVVHAAAARVVVASGSVAAAAAHQVGFQIVSLLSCTAVPLNLGVQSLLASARASGSRARVRALVRAVLGQSALVGVGAGTSAALLLWLGPRLLTSDPAVLLHLRAIIPYCAAVACLWCQTSALYGVFVALNLLGPFVSVHAVGAVGALALITYGGGAFSSPLMHAWVASLLYSALRIVVYAPVLARVLRSYAVADDRRAARPGVKG